MNHKTIITVASLAALVVTGAVTARDWGKYQVGESRSGYTYMTDQTRFIQDDDFENPAMLWVERGESHWQEAGGTSNKSCQDCHGDVTSMKGVGARYPVYAPETGKMMNLEQRINQCRTERQGAEAFKWEKDEMLSLTTLVRHQSRGMPVAVVVDGEAAPFLAKGKALYEQRRGQLDLACMHCHEMYPGGQLRANVLSQGQSNGFPTYRLKWQGVGSIQRRIRGCNSMVRAEPYAWGAEENIDIELYLAHRGRGLPIETPAVRN